MYNVHYFYRATIAQDYDNFWVGITSYPVEIVQNDAVASIATLISSIIRRNSSNIAVQLPLLKTKVREYHTLYQIISLKFDCFSSNTKKRFSYRLPFTNLVFVHKFLATQ